MGAHPPAVAALSPSCLAAVSCLVVPGQRPCLSVICEFDFFPFQCQSVSFHVLSGARHCCCSEPRLWPDVRVLSILPRDADGAEGFFALMSLPTQHTPLRCGFTRKRQTKTRQDGKAGAQGVVESTVVPRHLWGWHIAGCPCGPPSACSLLSSEKPTSPTRAEHHCLGWRPGPPLPGGWGAADCHVGASPRSQQNRLDRGTFWLKKGRDKGVNVPVCGAVLRAERLQHWHRTVGAGAWVLAPHSWPFLPSPGRK